MLEEALKGEIDEHVQTEDAPNRKNGTSTKMSMNHMNTKRFIFSVSLVASWLISFSQTEILEFKPDLDTVKIETSNYVSRPDFRYGSSYKTKTQIDLVLSNLDSTINFQWIINESNFYFRNKVITLNELEKNYLNIFSGLKLDITLSQKGDLVEFKNFDTIKDTIIDRYGKLLSKIDSTKHDTENNNSKIDIDPALINFYQKSLVAEEIFLDLHFPEILVYFQLSNMSFKLYESNSEIINSFFKDFRLFEIEMSRNTMMVQNNQSNCEIECQIELTSNGCKSVNNQLKKRLKKYNNRKSDVIQKFNCEKARIIQAFKYDKQKRNIISVYQKKTLIVNGEPYYYWINIKIK